jgi:signal transduction histidine kinase
MDVIAHMSQTINDFRNFLKPNKEELHFSVKETIQRALNFVAGSFNDCNIRVEVDMENDVLVCGQSNDYSQVILNILNNAREACVDRQVADARIAVHLFKNNDKSVVTITDNAGGIPEEIIGKVFDPYFSTKESGGTGIGLYMSKTIIEKNMKGRLSVRNNGNGAEFRIEV